LKTFNRILLSAFSILLVSFGASLAMKSAIGVGAWDSVSQTVSLITGIKVGTFSMILNSSCVAVQWLLLGKKFKIKRLLQVGVAILLGMGVNWVYYNLMGSIAFGSYPIQLMSFVVGMLIISFGVAMILTINYTAFPLEALCLVISDRTGWNFGKLRQGVDFGSIVVSLSLTLLFSSIFTVREGTVIGMLIFGPSLEYFMKRMKPSLQKIGMAD